MRLNAARRRRELAAFPCLDPDIPPGAHRENEFDTPHVANRLPPGSSAPQRRP
jgi:hypothetical protein